MSFLYFVQRGWTAYRKEQTPSVTLFSITPADGRFERLRGLSFLYFVQRGWTAYRKDAELERALIDAVTQGCGRGRGSSRECGRAGGEVLEGGLDEPTGTGIAVLQSSGEVCLETLAGKAVGRAGSDAVIIPAGAPMRLSVVGKEKRGSLMLVLHESSTPWMTPATDCSPKGIAAER